jgi:hypothetical protein
MLAPRLILRKQVEFCLVALFRHYLLDQAGRAVRSCNKILRACTCQLWHCKSQRYEQCYLVDSVNHHGARPTSSTADYQTRIR